MTHDELLDEVADVTPEDLRAIRIRIGLQPNELSELLGLGGRRDVIENLEKSRTWTMFQGHVDVLQKLEKAFDERWDKLVEQNSPDVLITYPNDGVMAKYDPEAVRDLRFATVHRMLMATVQKHFAYDGIVVPMQALIPAKFEEYLEGRKPTLGLMEDWALRHMLIYRMKPGNPILGQREV